MPTRKKATKPPKPAAAPQARPEHSVPLGSVAAITGESSVPVARPLPDQEEMVMAPIGAMASQPGLIGHIDPSMIFLVKFPAGCYRISYTPYQSKVAFHGTLRVDKSGSPTTISGDLYKYATTPFTMELMPIKPYGIPIYPRDRYYSYLKVTNLKYHKVSGSSVSGVTLTADEYVYTQPAAGAYNGTFPAAATRTVVIVLAPQVAPAGYSSSYFTGELYVGGVAKGTVKLGRVSSYFRKATVEVDTLVDAATPQAVPAVPLPGTEDIRTAYGSAGWDVTVVYDQTNIPVPAYVANSKQCWSSANLHQLMQSVRKAGTNLDTEWRSHFVVVPGKMGCGRGVMYDSINVPREGSAAYSDDGYPASESAWFGTAANQQARNVPRAFLRTAIHEIGHAFNLIHQEQEGGADNSIMTTTPSVADVLQGAASGAAGIFPNDINLHFNEHCRHHLAHFPDIVVRPGGMTFGSGHSSVVPEADRNELRDELSLTLAVKADRIELGEPLRLAWTLTNVSSKPQAVPSDIGLEAQHAFVTINTPSGESRPAPSYVIRTDHVRIAPLAPGASLKGEARVFWSTNGFAFEAPGRYSVELRIIWTHAATPFGVKETTSVWVNYPPSPADNNAAATLMHPEVGKYVALGGSPHLAEAVSRLKEIMGATTRDASGGSTALRGYQGILP